MLFSQLSSEEQDMIQYFIDTYAYNDCSLRNEPAPLKTLLSEWNKNKQRLYKLLGNQLQVSMPVCIDTPKGLLKSQMNDLIYENYDHSRFRNDILNNIYDIDNNDAYRHFSCEIFDSKALVNNLYEGKTFEIKINGKQIRIQNGMKTIKIIAKVANLLGLDKEFEEFRLEHSRILNVSKLEGELVLSIHPLDYITMSDNDCGWNSCMSWIDEGCYRRGTVEMMNSEDVIVCYLKSKQPYSFGGGYEWDGNKKWRTLLVFNDDVMASVKGYPYQSRDLVKVAFAKLAELAETNLGLKFENKTHKFKDRESFEVNEKHYCFNFYPEGYMYNDFGTCTHYLRMIEGLKPDTYTYAYGGPATCMCCGSKYEYYSSEQDLVCDSCKYITYCACCGERIYEDDAYIVNDEYYCEYCYNDRFTTVWNSEEPVDRDDCIFLHLLDKNYLEWYEDKEPYRPAKIITANVPNIFEDTPKYLLDKYFINPNLKIKKYSYVVNSNCGWSDHYYYVEPKDLTDIGLRELFGLKREDIDRYLSLIFGPQEELRETMGYNRSINWNW